MVMIAVVGSHDEEHPDAETLGKWLAGQQVHLLTGGGPGVMEAVSRGFASAPRQHGHSIAILPVDSDGNLKHGYPNPWIQIPIYTHLHGQKNANGSGGNDPEGVFSRNHINARSAHVMVAFSGGAGTLAEVKLALNCQKPVLAFLPDNERIGGKDSAGLTKHFESHGGRLQTFSNIQALQGALLGFI